MIRIINTIFNTEWKKKKWATIALHIVVWLVIFLLPYVFNANYDAEQKDGTNDKNEFRTHNTVTNLLWVALFYFNAAVLIPLLIYKKKFVVYGTSLLGLFGVIILLHGALFPLTVEGRTFNFFRSAGHNLIAFFFTITVSTAYKTISDKIKADKHATEKQNENLKTELSFLRSQISPHFLFNVLNNIVALVRMKSNDLEPTVMKLSALMQYMLYEADEEKVLLKSEVEYLQNYIDLQKQRFGPEFTLNLGITIQEDWHTIEPMLLIPFVENAFKHGDGFLHHPEINIHLSVTDHHLYFTVKNKFEDKTVIKDKSSGIGLANVKRRLELLYPSRHALLLDKKDGWFIVSLQLTLK